MNKVGTFGVASASYYWSRVAAAVGRLFQYIVGHEARTWHLLVADDYHLDARGPAYREGITVFYAKKAAWQESPSLLGPKPSAGLTERRTMAPEVGGGHCGRQARTNVNAGRRPRPSCVLGRRARV